MGIDHSTHAPGHGSASISHKFSIRERKFGRRWHVYDHTTNSTVFESVRRGACVKWIENHQDLFHLAASHHWGMTRKCIICGKLRPLARFLIRKNGNWRGECRDCDNARRRRQRERRKTNYLRNELILSSAKSSEPWWTVFEEV